MSAVEEVPNYFQSFLFLETHSRDIGSYDKTWDEKHRTSIFSRPMTIMGLEVFIERVAVLSSLQRAFRRGKSRQVLV